MIVFRHADPRRPFIPEDAHQPSARWHDVGGGHTVVIEILNYVKYMNMEHPISATELARSLGDVLAKVRYRHDSFIIERNGTPVARVVPIEGAATDATLGEALAAWCQGSAEDRTLADDLAGIGAADRPPDNPWAS